ncbi:hypothetical protein [Paenirhodobacter populi]|nr:hypothetical protein [Sinirhodobacter populi]
MDTATAFEIVLDLAKQGMISSEEMPEEYERQREAINILEDLAVNQFGDY